MVLLVLAIIGALMLTNAYKTAQSATFAERCKTGINGIDRLNLATFVVARFGLSATLQHCRAIVAICHNELPASMDSTPPLVGDSNLAGGPSIGPLQVYRATAIDLGLVPSSISREDYAALALDENRCIEFGIAAFEAKLNAADGNFADAIRRYNGGGSAAESYRARALAFLDATFDDGLGDSAVS